MRTKRYAAERQLRAEQNKEYEESLKVDRAKRTAKLEKERLTREWALRRQQRYFVISCYRATLREENYRCDKQDRITIQFRFPNGARKIHSFSPHDPIERLFEAAHLHESCPIFFQLFIYPRKEIDSLPEWFRTIMAHHLADVIGKETSIEQLSNGNLSPEASHPITPWLRTFQEVGLENLTLVLVQNVD
ncbi:unnamed protein product, partial [Mesorhabditis belari]|uniref:UBX domain-containing protein n=1 Tax=Mesorhabditis belari TaxID=2138241 RepID=A0AAF3ELF9_9BILA